jgi:hypothetical protein
VILWPLPSCVKQNPEKVLGGPLWGAVPRSAPAPGVVARPGHATGPVTARGKERSSRDATRHGPRSQRPVLPGEGPGEWGACRACVVADLGPGNTVATGLAERVAFQPWRPRRAARYQAQVAAEPCDAA